MCSAEALVAERYRLIRPLGRGGMGRVWHGHDELLDRDVAIKEIGPPPGLASDEFEAVRKSTLQEARAAARLGHHPNVVRIYDAVCADDRAWIVMEYVPSRSLHEVVNQDGPVPPRRAARIGLEVLGALRAAHRVGVLHRDVKPSNVLLAEDGRVVLSDFGLATFSGVDGTITQSEFVLGSPQYIAPERARDGVSLPESDLWSLGATLYTAVEGRSPYARMTATATLTALAVDDPDPAPHAGSLKPVLSALLKKNPRERAGIDEAERLLLRAASPPEPSSEGPALAGIAVTGRHWVFSAAVVVVALVAALVAMAIADPRTSQAGTEVTRSVRPTPPAVSPAAVANRPRQPRVAVSPAPAPAAFVPSKGWVWYDDPTGFGVAVPAGWRKSIDGSIVYFRDPRGGRVLGIDQTGRPKRDPVADWRRQERQRSGGLRGYRRVGIVTVDYWLRCADWEYTYLGHSGNRLHVIDRGFVTSSRKAYAIFWLTRDVDWADNFDSFSMVAATFRPARS